nr:glycosyltransferase [Methanomicrobium sp. W14]
MISIIIPALNEENRITACLKSLSDQSLPRDEYEIIIVDGFSSDKTCKKAEYFADKVIFQKRKGIGGARRDGVEAASGDILVFTDADTLYSHRWLERIKKNLMYGGYDVCTGPVRFYDGNICSLIIQVWRKYYHLLHLFGFYWLIGSNVAVKKDIYIEAGGHRSISVLEDYDLSLRLFSAGASYVYDRQAEVYTSARRIKGIFAYMLTYIAGFYNYHITKDDGRLLRYSCAGLVKPSCFPKKRTLNSILQKISMNRKKWV